MESFILNNESSQDYPANALNPKQSVSLTQNRVRKLKIEISPQQIFIEQISANRLIHVIATSSKSLNEQITPKVTPSTK